MVVVLNRKVKDSEKQRVKDFLEEKGFMIREIQGEEETILGAVGSISIDFREVEVMPGVERVIPISKPYKLASREFKKEDTVVKVGPVKIGGSRITVISGPCAIESKEQIFESAKLVKESGGVILRGGAYKPRTSPYSFQGLGEEGLKYMKEAGEKYGLPIASEVVSTEAADMMSTYLDVFQIGARSMQNFELLKKVGSIGKPVILKRGLSATIEEWLMAAEYLLAHGTEDVILCERGIRTFETYTRNTLDISAIPVVKKLSHLPVIVDPSHATGLRGKVLPMALASVAAGADGLLVEMHPDPTKALSDGPQSLYPEQFEKLMRDTEALSAVIGKELSYLPVPELNKETQTANIRTKSGLKVAFQGEHGAYSEIAISRYFNDESESVPCNSFRDVFKSVLHGDVDYGVLPMENSLAGSIHENYDLLLQFPDLQIVGEKKIRIAHNLIGLPNAELKDIKKIYSHPQGLAQCAKFINGNSAWSEIPFYDTAGSVAFIAKQKDKSLAAIASSKAAKVYGMKILKESIETNPQNYTRFFVLSRDNGDVISEANKASIVFSVKDKPGALATCLNRLAKRSLNLTKLESRPIHGKPWQYMFYADVQISDGIDNFHEGIEEIKDEIEDFKILGIYKV